MPIALREDFDARSMRSAAKRAKVAAQTGRLAALAAIYEGASREKAAESGGVRFVRALFPFEVDLGIAPGARSPEATPCPTRPSAENSSSTPRPRLERFST